MRERERDVRESHSGAGGDEKATAAVLGARAVGVVGRAAGVQGAKAGDMGSARRRGGAGDRGDDGRGEREGDDGVRGDRGGVDDCFILVVGLGVGEGCRGEVRYLVRRR